MTLAAAPPISPSFEHIVLEDISWEFYELLLREIGDNHVLVTYDEGRMEIMSPLPKHELSGHWIGRLIELMCFERGIHIRELGSTTFRDQLKKIGLEPDECYYVQHVDDIHDIDGPFDPAVYPPPDIAIEIDITHRSIARADLRSLGCS